MKKHIEIIKTKENESSKKYIVYREYHTGLVWTRQRVELTKIELVNYLENHFNEIQNIEIFRAEDKLPITIDTYIKIGE